MKDGTLPVDVNFEVHMVKKKKQQPNNKTKTSAGFGIND